MLLPRFLQRLAQGGEDGVGVLPLPQHHADGQCDFRVENVLPVQAREQVAQQESVVGRRAQLVAHPLESEQEAGEVLIDEAPPRFFQRQLAAVVLLRQRHQRFRCGRAFQV
jgi:hypothetical protein